MFTGIISEIGKVRSIVRKGSSARLEIICDKVKDNVNLATALRLTACA